MRDNPATQRWPSGSWAHLKHLDKFLLPHQTRAVQLMVEERPGSNGKFVVMDTGTGKTLVALAYAHHWLTIQGGDSFVEQIVWVAPKCTIENLTIQLTQGWYREGVGSMAGLPVHVVPACSAKQGLHIKRHHINIINMDFLRNMVGAYEKFVPKSMVVFDEVDEMYASTLRTSAALEMANLCPNFVAQTATPMRKNEAQLIMWLRLTCPFPVCVTNYMVAAASMVAIQVQLGIEVVEEEVVVNITDEMRVCNKQLYSTNLWSDMAEVAQRGSDTQMVAEAVRHAVLDREQHADGGVLLVAANAKHADELVNRIMQTSGQRAGKMAQLEAGNEYGIIVVTKDAARGYNSAVRMGVMVTGVYPGNAATRYQIRGRLRRIGQKRSQVRYVTVFMEHTILQLLHQRHSSVDGANVSLQQLAEKFNWGEK